MGGGQAQVAVLVVDDHRVFTDVLRLGLDRQPDLRCAAVAHSVHEALAQASAVQFEVAVVDLDLPDGIGLELIGRLRQVRPEARVVVLTALTRPDLAVRALAAGAVAFLGKDGTLDRVLSALRSADADHRMVDGADRGEAGGVELTQREHEVLRNLGLGLDASQIAQELGISLYTTRDHIKAVIGKLGAHSQLGAVVAGERLGLIRVGSRY